MIHQFVIPRRKAGFGAIQKLCSIAIDMPVWSLWSLIIIARWGEVQENAFEAERENISSEPVFGYWYYITTFILSRHLPHFLLLFAADVETKTIAFLPYTHTHTLTGT